MRNGRLPGFAASRDLVWLKGFGDLPEIRDDALELIPNFCGTFLRLVRIIWCTESLEQSN